MIDNVVFSLTCQQGISGDVEQALLTCQGGDALPQLSTAAGAGISGQVAFLGVVHDYAGARSTLEAAIDRNQMNGPGPDVLMALEDWSTAVRLGLGSSKTLKPSYTS